MPQIIVVLCCLGNSDKKMSIHVHYRSNYFSSIFYPKLIEFLCEEPLDEGQLYLCMVRPHKFLAVY
jgi:hypothetical protein